MTNESERNFMGRISTSSSHSAKPLFPRVPDPASSPPPSGLLINPASAPSSICQQKSCFLVGWDPATVPFFLSTRSQDHKTVSAGHETTWERDREKRQKRGVCRWVQVIGMAGSRLWMGPVGPDWLNRGEGSLSSKPAEWLMAFKGDSKTQLLHKVIS